MDVISVGPFLLSTPRLLALLSLSALLASAAALNRMAGRADGGWAFAAAISSLLGARLLHVLIEWPAYRVEPLSTLYLWQGGFHPAGAAVGALLYAAWHWWRGRLPLAQAVIPLGLAALVWAGGQLALQAARTPGLPLPAATLAAVDGGTVELEALRDRPVVLNLWATWCPPCRREMPLLQEMEQKHSDVVFLLVNQGEESARVQAYLAHAELELRHVLLDRQQLLADHFQVPGYPTTLFFDADGRQIERYSGELNRSYLERWIARLREH